MNRRFDVFVASVALAVGFATQTAEAAIGPSDYIQDGLVALYDAEFNAKDEQANPVHDDSATTWANLVSGTGDLVLPESGVTIGANEITFDKVTAKAADCSIATQTGPVTLETCARSETTSTASGNNALMLVSVVNRAGVGLDARDNQSAVITSTDVSDFTKSKPKYFWFVKSTFASYAPVRRTYSGVVPVNGATLYANGAAAASAGSPWTASAAAAPTGGLTVGNTKIAVACNCVRVYNRELSLAEIQYNNAVDAVRFRGVEPATVVSGTVTVAGKTYAAGEAFPFSSADVVAIDLAEDATIALPKSVSSVTLKSGTLALANGDAVLKTIGNLTLGADARLKLTGNGLQVTGTVTADASAAVVGPGVFVAKEDATPVALEGGATYFSSRGAFAGWPDSGVACLPVGTVAMIATEEDVTKVAGLDGVVFLDDGSEAAAKSSVKYTAATPLTLAARVSGPGAFIAENSGRLVLLGDNSALIAPGHFAFTNSPVIVSNRCGLGSSATGAAWLMFGARSSIDFGCDTPAFTNDVAIRYERSGSNLVTIGPRNAGEEFCQNADFIHQTGGNVYIRNTVKFIGGLVKNVDGYATGPGATRYLYFNAASGHDAANPAHLWFKDGVTFSFHYCLFMYNSANYGLNVHFCKTAKPYNSAGFSAWHYVFEDDDVFTAGGSPWPFGGGKLDLNGHDQSVSQVALTYCGNTPTASSGTKYTVTTEMPATLTCTSTSQQYMPAKFSGAAGYRHNSTGTNRIVNAISDSTNLLEVAKGGVILKWSAGWGGDALVRAGASLELDSDKAFLDGKSRLEVEVGGKLVLKAGTMCYLRSAKIAGTELDVGDSYSVARLRDEMGLPVAGDDLAQITVSGASEWQGWPTEPGGRAFVPVDCTVYASDDDVEKIAACGKIYLSPGAKVICTNLTKTLNLTAQISGQGTFRILDADNVVLLGDNSALQSPGAFWFSNSCVTVSNRYGLGSSTTARAVYHYGDRVGSLRFGSEGLTNDVALTVYPNKKSGCHIVGPESPDEDLVFNSSYRFNGGPDRVIQFRNRVHFRGGVFGTLDQDGKQDNHIYSRRSGAYAEVWFENDVKVHYYYWFASACIYHLGWAGLDWGYLFTPYTDNPQVICERDGLFGKSVTGLCSLGSSSPMDLNGHQVVTPHVVSIYGGGVQVYTSDLPATLTVTNLKVETGSNYLWVKPMFKGAAGFTYAGCGTNEFRTYFSDTTGPLTIVRNAFRLTQGAGWGGTNVTVKAGARLILADTAAEQPFVAPKTRAETALTVEEGGKIEINLTEKPVKVRSFTYAGMPLERGVYTKANCAAIEGEGSVKVLGNPGLVLIVR